MLLLVLVVVLLCLKGLNICVNLVLFMLGLVFLILKWVILCW